MARILSLDVGEKRIGIAVSDSGGTIAQGVKVYHTSGSRAKDLAEIKGVVLEFDPVLIVIGSAEKSRRLPWTEGPRDHELCRRSPVRNRTARRSLGRKVQHR